MSNQPESLLRTYKKRVNQLLSEPWRSSANHWPAAVSELFKKKSVFLALTAKHLTPFYVFDQRALQADIIGFKKAFSRFLPKSEYFYAVKVNHYPEVLKEVLKHGFGLDVSSSRELKMGLKHGAKKMVFSGPGKTAADLALAVRQRQKVIVNIDNFSELKRLGEIAQAQRRKINCGVRIYTQYHGVWHKFGIALADLKKFWQQAKKYPYLNLQGIQFHLSLNYSALPYQNVIKELAKYLRRHFSPSELQQIKFIDFGGGFMPHLSEGVYSHFTPRGKIIKTANDYFQKPSVFKDKYYFTKTATAAEFAQGIAAAVNKHLKPLVSCVYFAEPGRIIANSAMHILLRVVDVKDKENVVVDGGINIVGHERYEEDYFPIINLTRPAKKEIDCRVWGPLCLPDDYL